MEFTDFSNKPELVYCGGNYYIKKMSSKPIILKVVPGFCNWFNPPLKPEQHFAEIEGVYKKTTAPDALGGNKEYIDLGEYGNFKIEAFSHWKYK